MESTKKSTKHAMWVLMIKCPREHHHHAEPAPLSDVSQARTRKQSSHIKNPFPPVVPLYLDHLQYSALLKDPTSKMSNYEVRTLEERIAAIEENLGITGAKTLRQASEEEAVRRKNASAQAFRTKYAPREIPSKEWLEKMLRSTIVIFCDSLDDPNTRRAIEEMDDLFSSMTNGRMLGYVGTYVDVHHSWGFWEKSNPMFELSDEELEDYTEGNELPVGRLPDKDPDSSATTLMPMADEDSAMEPLMTWFDENEGKMDY